MNCKLVHFLIEFNDFMWSEEETLEETMQNLFSSMLDIIDFNVEWGYDCDSWAIIHPTKNKISKPDIEKYVDRLFKNLKHLHKKDHNGILWFGLRIFIPRRADKSCTNYVIERLRCTLGDIFDIEDTETFGEYFSDTLMNGGEEINIIIRTKTPNSYFEKVVLENADIISNLAKEMICEWVGAE